MTTFTDKELIKEIKERIGSLDVRDNIERRAYEIALASLEAEAVMFCISGQNVDSEEHVSTSKAVVDAWVEEWNQVDGSPGEPLYKTMPLYYHAALPAPVVPEEATPENVEMLSGYVSTYKLTDSERDIAAEIWNACRAAMLQSQGNCIKDGWISCSERMPPQDDWILIYSKHGEYMAGQVQGEYVELSDGTLSWLGNALFWMPLPEPTQEVNRG
ncbi:TPA: DUF551 domain-containing protein [Escherichia coli]|nr:DUF551 domain-containing protein [Escherichia coli]HDK2202452.1 DUF551 domain-containing protein [Escherichia coli]